MGGKEKDIIFSNSVLTVTGVLYDGGVGGWSRDLKVIRELLKVIKQDVDFMSKSSVSKYSSLGCIVRRKYQSCKFEPTRNGRECYLIFKKPC